VTLTRLLGFLAGAALVAAPAVEGKTAKKEYRVTCKDGTTSRPGQGACSGHGGIDKNGKSGLLCNDGKIVDPADKNACKDHDGIAKKGTKELDSDKQVKARKERETRERDRTAVKSDKNGDRVVCKDGTVTSGRLGCFGHDGVAEPADSRPNSATRPSRAIRGSGGDVGEAVNDVSRNATARCKDGKYSHAKTHKGACAGHGGVEKWLD
jgi:hypothetical protein